MACKACLMNDIESFHKIVKSTKPGEVKTLGRKVTPWVQEKWNDNVLMIAHEVCKQKFSAIYTDVLVSTEGYLIAETTKGDTIWGTGIDMDQPGAEEPEKWRGTNILGWALMMARQSLKT